MKDIIFAIMIVSFLAPATQAVELGRLFFTPEQRIRFETTYTRSKPESDSRSAEIIVSGIVQKRGGKRTVWINGVAQEVEQSDDRNPGTQAITVPGKPQPVRVKVGQKLFLGEPPPQPLSTNND